MTNRVILAPAGGSKTQHIIDCCSNSGTNVRRLVISFTNQTQDMLERRLLASPAASNMPKVQGWYSFLLDHIVRPYIHCIFPYFHVSSLSFETTSPPKNLRGSDYYFTADRNARSQRLSLLASQILSKDGAAVIDRLERVYDEIYIDEVQDLVGNDLDVLESLFSSQICVTLTGDTRQRTLSTSISDRKYAKYKGLGLIEWFREMDKAGSIELEEWRHTDRCCQEVISFADTMFKPGLYDPTISRNIPDSNTHHGIWIVTKDTVSSYIELYAPAVYRHSKRTPLVGTDSAITFGQCKGATEDHVLIFPTKTMISFLIDRRNELAEQSRMGAYVAITRARWSVAFYIDSKRASDIGIPFWRPSASTF